MTNILLIKDGELGQFALYHQHDMPAPAFQDRTPALVVSEEANWDNTVKDSHTRINPLGVYGWVGHR
jgi:hypothetical protein